MKLLLEQKEYLENKMKTLRKEISEIQMQKKAMVGDYYSAKYRAKYEETQILGDLLSERMAELNYYQSVLSSSEIITEFNHEKIDIGTSFRVKFQDDESICEYTLIDKNLGFGSEQGYITRESKLGEAVYLKEASFSFCYSIEDEEIAGEILEIIPKKAISISQLNKDDEIKSEKLPVSKGVKERHIKNTDNDEDNCVGFKNYIAKLKKYERSSSIAKREMERLMAITPLQAIYLRKRLAELSRKKSYDTVIKRTLELRKAAIAHHLAEEIIVPEDLTAIDLGTKMILEVDSEGKKNIEYLELVPLMRGLQAEGKFVSVRNRIGFGLYKTQIGDIIKFNKTTISPRKAIKVLQFGIDKDKLLNPASANIPALSYKEKEQSLLRVRYQNKYHPDMTLSQWRLFDTEVSKISSDACETPYIERLNLLKEMVSSDDIEILTGKKLKLNREQIGIGSKVCYYLLEDGKTETHTTELISCAYTVEEKDKYTESFTPLGKSLMGKKKDDCFEIKDHGTLKKGVVLSVCNEILEQEYDDNVEWEAYYESNRPKLVREQVEMLQVELEKESIEIETLQNKLSSVEVVNSHGNYDTLRMNMQKELSAKRAKVQNIELAFSNSSIVENEDSETIEVGSQFRVIIEDEAGEPDMMDVVLIEKKIANEPSDRFLSIESDFGKAVLHKKVGEHFCFATKDGNTIHGVTTQCEMDVLEKPFIKAKK